MQMGVEVSAVAEPVTAETRRMLHQIARVEPIPGKVEGSGPVFAFSHNSNAAFQAVNEILAAGGKVAFAKTENAVYATGAAAILKKDGVDATSLADTPAAVWPLKQPRIALYDPWGGNIDTGWTRWLFEQFHFPFTLVRNADIQNGHLGEHYDVIVIAEMGTRQILDGMAPGSVPGQYAGGIGETGAQALRDFVTQGGTLVTLGNATLFAMDQFSLALTNVVQGVPQNQFFCSGSLLRVELKDANHPLVAGLPATPAIMFERNPVFDTKPGFRGRVLASYVKDRSPLLSGFLLGADRIEGKAAALDADYGKGHIVMLAFRPQWRGQSHGTYKFLFNALYYNSSMAPEAAAREGGRGGNPQQAAWRREAESVKTELTKLLDQNRAYFTARGPRAAEEGKKLEDSLDAFQRDRLPLLDDLRAQVEDGVAARGYAVFSAQLKKFAVDIRTKDFSAAKLEDLLDQYKLTVTP
jgi:ribosomal protein S18 acetylase RimI-like enzyme